MTTFLIQIFNFILLLFFAKLLVMPALRGYFYSRRVRIKKEMTRAAMQLKNAQEHIARSKALVESLEMDARIVRNDIESSAKMECDRIMETARKERGHIMEYISAQVAYDERRSKRDVGRKLLEVAFCRTYANLQSMLSPGTENQIMEEGLGGIGRRFGNA
jgi:F0F1-type ATP synthase membrane subunit b/b'